MTMLMGLVSSCSDDGVSELCFVGDSLVAGWDVKASFPTYVVRNDGVSGARVEDILTWNLDYRDKNVVMLIGTNNLGYEFINEQTRPQFIADFVEAYRHTIEALAPRRVFVISILPRSAENDDKNISLYIRELNAALSQMVSTLVYLAYVFRKRSAFTFSIKLYAPSRKMTAEILKIGIPTLAFQLLTSLSIALINRSANSYGDAVIAGMGAVTRITSMGTLVVFGFLKGFQPIAGFSYGAKKFNRLREAIKTSIVWSTAFCLVVGLLMAIFSTQIISQFTDGNAEMIAVGQKSLMANGFSFILFGFYTVYSSLFLALGKGTAGFFLGVCRQGICFIPAILLLPVVWGLNGILYAQPIADVMTAVITVFMALHLHKELSMAERNAIPEKSK